jgi:hypothetical protein
MIVSTSITSMTAITSPNTRCRTPMPTGAASEATPAPIVRQGVRSWVVVGREPAWLLVLPASA